MIQPGQYYSILPNGKWEIYLDATMCSTFGQCEMMFYESFVQSLTPKGERPFARDLGSWWSEVMEHVYGGWFRTELTISAMDALKIATQVWEDLKMDELEKYHPRSYKQFGGRYGALAMIADYFNRQLPVDYQTWKIVASEASFGRNKEVCIGETERIILFWMGQPDLFVVSGSRLFPVDHKSVAYIDSNTAKRYKPHIQIPGYIIAGQILCKSLGMDIPVDRAIINCVARSDRQDKSGESKHPRFRRISVSYSPEELEEWRSRRLEQAERLRYCFENNKWAWNEAICSNYYNRPCSFQNIHEKPPAIRQVVIAADYVKRDFWIPGKHTKEENNKTDD